MDLRFAGRFGADDLLLDSDLRDLEIHQGANGAAQLFAVTGLNGGIASYSLGRGAPVLRDAVYHRGLGLAGGEATLAEIGGETRLLVEGSTRSAMAFHQIGGNGQLAAQEQAALPGAGAAGLEAMVVGSLSAGEPGAQSVVYGLVNGRLSGWQMGAGGAPGEEVATRGSASAYDRPGAVALELADLGGGAQVLLLADRIEQGVRSYRVDAQSGALTPVASLGAADGLGVAEPTALESFNAYGRSWAVMAAAGSSSLSLIALGAGGQMTLTDHVLDTAATRFGGVAALEVVDIAGEILVLAVGSDDGLALFRILPEGQLVHVQSLIHARDTGGAGLGLENVTALAAVVVGDELQIFAASGRAEGLSQFTLSLAELGDVTTTDSGRISGTRGSDVLAGGIGAVLSGGAGADVFVLRPAEEGRSGSLRITDFEAGQDSLDLSGFDGLRSLDGLQIRSRSDGATLTHQAADGSRTEVVVQSRDGDSLETADLFADGFVFADRMLPPAEAPDPIRYGSGGADRITARTPGDQINGLGGNDTLLGGDGRDSLWGDGGHDRLVGGNGVDRLRGQAGNDVLLGQDARDLLVGGAGRDTMDGGRGADRLLGGADADLLRGGGQNDLLRGGAQGDRLIGQSGRDKLFGQKGNDTLDGGSGHDTLTGGAGADVFVFGRGHGIDRIRDFTQGEDVIHLGRLGRLGIVEDMGDLRLQQQGDNTLIQTGGGDILLLDQIASELGADDFIF
ncbi:calcium-binding protein [Phaeobacter sp. C3_T13_0]|uniref:calcium-binding protein n=1 Tax=Phaeobacter cretensis TaxID=3342641 RepID=UPI0039BCF2D7